MLKEIKSEEFSKEVLESKSAVLVDFFASWCPPCKMIAQVLEKIANSRADFNIIKVNIDENIELANRYKIEAVPTILIFKNGEVVNKLVGLVDKDTILSTMSNYVY